MSSKIFYSLCKVGWYPVGKGLTQVRNPVPYGDRVRALIAYFSHEHFIPVDRVCEIFKDIFGVTLSPGTCTNVDERSEVEYLVRISRSDPRKPVSIDDRSTGYYLCNRGLIFIF